MEDEECRSRWITVRPTEKKKPQIFEATEGVCPLFNSDKYTVQKRISMERERKPKHQQRAGATKDRKKRASGRRDKYN